MICMMLNKTEIVSEHMLIVEIRFAQYRPVSCIYYTLPFR